MSNLDSTRLTCSLHPGAAVRRYRTHGPNGPGVYPQCVPEGGQPHLLTWQDAAVPHARGSAATDPAGSGLSPAEFDVLQAAARGLTVAESAAELGKGRETVKTQRHQIILKFGARNIAHAVAIAAMRGLVDLDPSCARNVA